MRKILRRSLIAILITLSMIAVVGIAVFAAETTQDKAVASATVGGQTVYYDSLEEAVTAAYADGNNKDANGYYTVTVHKDTAVSARLHVPGKLRLVGENGKKLTVSAQSTQTNGMFCVCTNTCNVGKAGDVSEDLTVENLTLVHNGTNAASAIVTLNDTTGAEHDLTFKNVNVNGKKNMFYNSATTTKGTYNITIDGGIWATSATTNSCLIYEKYSTGGSTTVENVVNFNLNVSNMTLKAGIYQAHRGNLGTETNRAKFTNVTIDSPWYLLVPVGDGYTHTYLEFDKCNIDMGVKAIAGTGSQKTQNDIIDIVAKDTKISNDATMALFVNSAHDVRLDFNNVELFFDNTNGATNTIFTNYNKYAKDYTRGNNRVALKFVDVKCEASQLWDGTDSVMTDFTSIYIDNFTKSVGAADAFDLNVVSKTGCDVKILNTTGEDLSISALDSRTSVYMDQSSAGSIKVPEDCLTSPATFDTDKGSVNGSVIYITSLKKLVENYRKENSGAAEHTITTSHRLIYNVNAYFKDHVNATTSVFSCYAKLGADELKIKLKDLGITVPAYADTTAAKGKEILIGVVDRSAQNSFRSKIDVNEYGIFVTDKNIILLAWNDVALKACVEFFLDYLSAEKSIPVGFEFIDVADDDWKTDFVRPENTALKAGQYINDDSIQFLYTGAGATKDGYTAYCKKLTDSGFKLVWTNTVGNNVFGLYKNEAKDIALYVAYNDYTFAADYNAKYQANYSAATNACLPGNFEKCIRIVSSPLSSLVLPDEINSQQTYEKVTDSYMTTLGITNGNVGTGHVFMLEDGRFIVVDGGNCTCNNDTWCEHVSLIWNALENLYKKAHGHAPSANEPICVAAWYLTHGHGDHYAAFQKMIRLINSNTAKKAVFKIEYIIANLPGEYSLFKNTSTTFGYSAEFANMQTYLGGIKLIKPHAGQKLYFANVMIEVLMTYEDHLPFTIINTNDTNTVTRFHVGSTYENTGVSGKTTTVMFLGDSWRPSSRFLCAMYGEYLKSDISQIAHHGNIGCEKELYDAIAPSGILFNNTYDASRRYIWGRYNGSNPESTNAYAVDKYVVRELSSVQCVLMAVEGKCPTLKFTAVGADYDGAFDLATGAALNYKNTSDSADGQTGFINKKAANAHVHSYAWVSIDDTYHKDACECGAVNGVAEHMPEADDNDCTTEIKCADCGHVMVEAKASHTPNADGSKCNDCGVAINPDSTKPVESTTPDTEKVKEGGCKGSVTTVGLALIASLGICTAFVEKKRR